MKDLWVSKEIASEISYPPNRGGIRIRFQPNANTEVRESLIKFLRWVRINYAFPVRVPIYVKNATKVKALDGEYVSATFFGPFNPSLEPYIRIAIGDYGDIKNRCGKDNALATILYTVCHELSHYYQWIGNVNSSDRGLEIQAVIHAKKIMAEYQCVREHP